MAIKYRHEGSDETILLTPTQSWATPVWKTNKLVASWKSSLNEVVQEAELRVAEQPKGRTGQGGVRAVWDESTLWCGSGHRVRKGEFCTRCGRPAITECDNGHEVLFLNEYGRTRNRPRYCSKCGTPYPWAEITDDEESHDVTGLYRTNGSEETNEGASA